jgi:PhzF family phenazine biosynthesis protein
MKVPYYHVDAFASRPFAGNPAGVCVLDAWLPDAVLQQIAFENNLSETAFVVARAEYYDLRWFTPAVEVDLCGHATLAAAFVLFTYLGHPGDEVHFSSQSGRLTVERTGDRLVLDFPSRPPQPCATPEALVRGLGCTPVEVRCARDYVAVWSLALYQLNMG